MALNLKKQITCWFVFALICIDSCDAAADDTSAGAADTANATSVHWTWKDLDALRGNVYELFGNGYGRYTIYPWDRGEQLNKYSLGAFDRYDDAEGIMYFSGGTVGCGGTARSVKVALSQNK